MGWKFSNKAAILVASEGGNYGTSPAVNSSNYKGLIVFDQSLKPMAERLKRDPIRQSFTPTAPQVGRKSVEIAFSTELKGCNDSSNPETATVLHDLLKACGLKTVSLDWGGGVICDNLVWARLVNESNCHAVAPFQSLYVSEVTGTINYYRAVVLACIRAKTDDSDATHGDWVILALEQGSNPAFSGTYKLEGTSDGSAIIANIDILKKGAAFQPTSDYNTIRSSSISIASFQDDILHLAPGCIGNVAFNMADGEVPRLDFHFYGLWNDPATSAPPADADMFTHLPPSVCAQDLMLAIPGDTTLTGVYKPNFSTIGLDMGNKIVPDKNLNAVECAGEFFLTDREPAGGINPAAEDLGTFNPWAAWKAGAERALSLCIGLDTTGNRAALSIPRAVYSDLSYKDRDGRLAYDIKFTCTGNVDDELFLIFG